MKNKAFSVDQHVALAYCITPQEISALYAILLLNSNGALCPLALIRPVHHTERTSTPLITLIIVYLLLIYYYCLFFVGGRFISRNFSYWKLFAVYLNILLRVNPENFIYFIYWNCNKASKNSFLQHCFNKHNILSHFYHIIIQLMMTIMSSTDDNLFAHTFLYKAPALSSATPESSKYFTLYVRNLNIHNRL